MDQNHGKISLVGAGPGSADLITVRGLRAIQSADAILYDALANKELLKDAPANCKLVYVGKRAGKHKYPQDKINSLLAGAAQNHRHVVRLKGGDPFIFGRGHEELVYLNKLGIQVEVIPGLSSATALPLLQDIPLTRRGTSDSFWVITGTTSSRQLSEDIEIAMKTSATLVILMGIRKIPQIAELLIHAGKKEVPIMVVQNGTYNNEKVVISNAEKIVSDVFTHDIGSPGIIVIGEVVALHPSLVLNKARQQWRA